MKTTVKVTLGLCVKNAEATISEAIDGILCQDFPHDRMELIVVDGYSTDRTLRIIKKKFLNSDIKTSFFEENTGLGMARQIVVDNSDGDYIVWVDGDIILSDAYVRKQVEFMEKNPHVGIAEGKYGFYAGKNLVSALENVVAVVHSQSVNISKIGGLAATEAAIWRVKALNEVGGFDDAITGAAEDIEVAYRIKKAGWLICATPEVFREACRETWRALWDQYYWYGLGAHFLHHKDKGMITLYKMLPLSGFLAGLLYSFRAYKLTQAKTVFLLPIHYLFKRTAWCLGFVKGHMDGYGHPNL